MDLSDIVARAVERVRRRAPDVTFDVSTSSWWVVGEATILERAVTNLLDNAAKCGPSDGVVTVRLEDGVLTVLDDGPGISDSDLPMVFERFWRADDARTLPGSGLGLCIVKQATERHGGHVTVANHEPHGTLVTMALPGQPDEIRGRRRAPGRPSRCERGHGPRVVLTATSRHRLSPLSVRCHRL